MRWGGKEGWLAILGSESELDTEFTGKQQATMFKGRGVETVLELDGRL